MSLSNDQKKSLRSIGHKLNPVVTVAEKGLSENVMEEINRALDDHELIKVKFQINDRDAKVELINEMCKAQKAELVQQIGKVALILRRNPQANPNLSNLSRPH